MKTAIVAYIPVLHQGYINFFAEFPYKTILVLGRSLTHHHRSFQKDIRALSPATAASALKSLNMFDHVNVIEEYSMDLLDYYDEIVLPDEDICREFAEKYCEGKDIVFGETFLRWDSNSAKAHKEVKDVEEVELTSSDQKKLEDVLTETHKSPDQYRQVAAAVFKEGEFCHVTHNEIVPLIYTYFYEGDPRSQFKKGVNIDLSLALHAEQSFVAWAASNKGVSLEGATVILTDFPCPGCAKLLAYSGVKKVYYLKGYAVVDGERILRDKDVEIYKIKTTS
jgi:dCMP deaminase